MPVILDTAVATGGDYSVITSVKNASQGAQVLGSQLFLWGEPGDASHDNSRGWNCLINAANEPVENPTHAGCAPEKRLSKAFLQLPTSCTSNWESSVLADSWLEPGEREADGNANPADPRWKGASTAAGPLEGCASLPFEPSITTEPESHAANTPTGLTVDVHVPQEGTVGLKGLSTSALKESIVSLPRGVMLSPSAANGLESCSTGLAGFTGSHEFQPGVPMLTFTPQLPEPLEPGVNFCPNGSKVGVVHIKTPDLPNELEGGVYLASQNANPFGSLFAMYIIAKDPVSGVLVKISGEIGVDPNTGQADHDLPQHAAGPVRRPQARTVRRPACLDHDAADLWPLRNDDDVRPVVGHPRQVAERRVRHHLRRGRHRLRESALAEPGLQRRRDQHAGRRLHRI